MAIWGSKRIESLVQSDIRAMTKECVRVGGINLGQGLCELPTPVEVVDGARSALLESPKNVYAPAEGLLSLRKKVAEKLKNENGITANPETEIVIVNGATGGYAAALMALLNPGDGVLLFEPYYGYHVNAARLAEIEPQFVPFSGPDLKIDETAIRSAIRSNTKAIVICSPSNPSGKMWTESELKTIGKIAKEKDLLVITDEMYEYFRFDGREHISPGSLPELKDRTVTIMGLSKTFSITGWRLGYVAAPEAIAQKIRLANDLFYVCAPTPLQYGAEAGFTMDKSYFTELREEFQERRNRMCDALDKAGLPPIVPQGAYYVLADITKAGLNDSKLFAMNMLETIGIAGVPGRSFFDSPAGNNYIRLHFAVEDSVLKEACDRIRSFKM